MNNNIYVFLGSLIVIISILISFFSSKFKQIEKDNIILKKEIYSLKKNSIENNIENFADSYEKENIKEMIIEQVNKIYDIDVDAIRNLGAISKSLLTGKNYHKHNSANPDEPGTLTIPANVIIEGELKVDKINTRPETSTPLDILTDVNIGNKLHVTGPLTTSSTLTVNNGPLITGDPQKYTIGEGASTLELVAYNNNTPSQIRVGTVKTDILSFGSRIAGKGKEGPAVIQSTTIDITKTKIKCGDTGWDKGFEKIEFCLEFPVSEDPRIYADAGVKKNSQFLIWNGSRQIMAIDTETEDILYIRKDKEKKDPTFPSRRPKNKSRGARIAFGTNVNLSMAKEYQKGEPALTILTKPEKDNNHPLVILDNTVLRHNHIHMNSVHAEEKLITDEDNPFNNDVQFKNKINTQTLHIPDGADIEHSIFVKGKGKTRWWKNKKNTFQDH